MTEHLRHGRNTFAILRNPTSPRARGGGLREHADARGAATVLEGDAARLRGRR